MPSQTRTRRDVRRAVGDALRVMELRRTTAAGAGDGSTLIDASLPGGDDEYNGRWFYVETDEDLQAADYTAADTAVTFEKNASAQIGSATVYEIWDAAWPPSRVNRVIDAAISHATAAGAGAARLDLNSGTAGKPYWGSSRDGSLVLSSSLSHVDRLEYRSWVRSATVLPAGVAWNESADADFTVSQDTEYFRDGGGAVKIAAAGTVSDGDKLSGSLAALNLSSYDRLELWLAVRTAVAASDLAIQLSDTANLASPVETITLPALNAREWTKVQASLANPELDTAIISAGLEYNANAAANTIWVGAVVATDSASEVWVTLPNHLYRLDTDTRTVYFTRQGRNLVSNRAVRAVGHNLPGVPAGDTSTIDAAPDVVETVALDIAVNGALTGVGHDALRRIPTPQGAALT